MNTNSKNWLEWLKETRYSEIDSQNMQNTNNWLDSTRNIVLNNSKIKKNDVVIDIGTGTGFLGIKILEKMSGAGKVIFADNDEECLNECKKNINNKKINTGYEIIKTDCTDIKISSNSIDKAVMRSVLVHIDNKEKALQEIYRILKPKGIFTAFEPVLYYNTRLSELIKDKENKNLEKLKRIESVVWNDDKESLFNYNYESLSNLLKNAGFSHYNIQKIKTETQCILNEKYIDSWMELKPAPYKKSLKERFLYLIDNKEYDEIINDIKSITHEKPFITNSYFALISAKK